MTEAEGRYDSVRGPVTTRWKLDGDGFRLTLTVPANTTAEVWIPAAEAAQVTHGTSKFLRMEDGCAVFAAGSGTHRFSN